MKLHKRSQVRYRWKYVHTSKQKHAKNILTRFFMSKTIIKPNKMLSMNFFLSILNYFQKFGPYLICCMLLSKKRVWWCLDFVKSHSWPHHQSQLKSNLIIGEKRFEFLGQCIHKQSHMSTHTGALSRPKGYIFRFTTLCELIHTVCQDTYSYLFFCVAWQCLHLHRLPQSSAPSA